MVWAKDSLARAIDQGVPFISTMTLTGLNYSSWLTVFIFITFCVGYTVRDSVRVDENLCCLNVMHLD